MKKTESDFKEKFFFQFIYDDEVLKLPWCNLVNEYYCPFDDFIEYVASNVILDYDYVDQFCRAEVGKDYINMPKPKPKRTPKPPPKDTAAEELW